MKQKVTFPNTEVTVLDKLVYNADKDRYIQAITATCPHCGETAVALISIFSDDMKYYKAGMRGTNCSLCSGYLELPFTTSPNSYTMTEDLYAIFTEIEVDVPYVLVRLYESDSPTREAGEVAFSITDDYTQGYFNEDICKSILSFFSENVRIDESIAFYHALGLYAEEEMN